MNLKSQLVFSKWQLIEFLKYYAASKEKNMKRAKKTIIQRSKKKIFSEQRKNIQQAKKKIIQWPSTLSKGKIMLLFAVILF